MLTNKLDATVLSARAVSRPQDNKHTDPRGAYFRDATAIMHSTPFRRLKHKTQVFFAPSNDHVCTRLEHVLHVSSIAVTICKALELDTDMAWAIGLGHDLGHSPFGHLGERVLSKVSGQRFYHELHSLRVVDVLNNLNLTYAVRDGIVTHCGEKFEQQISPTHVRGDIAHYTDRNNYSATFEGSVVRMADKIAYLGRDFEDAVTLGILERNELPLPVMHILGGSDNSSVINSFALDVIDNAKKHGTIGFSDHVHEALLEFKDFNYTRIYKSELLEAQSRRFEKLLNIVYDILHDATECYKDDIDAYLKSEYAIVGRLHAHMMSHHNLYDLADATQRTIAIIDYMAGMTDDYVISTVKESLFPSDAMSRM